jgi:hypothetical protein
MIGMASGLVHSGATGACTATAEGGTPFINTLAFDSVTWLLDATDGVSALPLAHSKRGREKRHWYRLLSSTAKVVERAAPSTRTPMQVPAQTSFEAPETATVVKFGLALNETPTSGQPAAGGTIAAAPSTMSSTRAAL